MATQNVQSFWANVTQGPGCWHWNGLHDSLGYGTIKWAGKRKKAHRVAYALLVGPVPEGLVIDHLCRNRGCVNPVHMEPVTQRENVLRGEGEAARHARKTHCIYGHPFDETNTYWTERPDGRRFRQCRTCAIARSRATRRKASNA